MEEEMAESARYLHEKTEREPQNQKWSGCKKRGKMAILHSKK